MGTADIAIINLFPRLDGNVVHLLRMCGYGAGGLCLGTGGSAGGENEGGRLGGLQPGESSLKVGIRLQLTIIGCLLALSEGLSLGFKNLAILPPLRLNLEDGAPRICF